MFLFFLAFSQHIRAQKNKPEVNPKVESWKNEVMKSLDEKHKTAQEMVDMVFSFSELGFQETETSAYLTDILKKNGFIIETGIAGIPTAWMAKWGNGKPIIALGSDIDCIPKASQKQKRNRRLLIGPTAQESECIRQLLLDKGSLHNDDYRTTRQIE